MTEREYLLKLMYTTTSSYTNCSNHAAGATLTSYAGQRQWAGLPPLMRWESAHPASIAVPGARPAGLQRI
jgi:hypothetical protein